MSYRRFHHPLNSYLCARYVQSLHFYSPPILYLCTSNCSITIRSCDLLAFPTRLVRSCLMWVNHLFTLYALYSKIVRSELQLCYQELHRRAGKKTAASVAVLALNYTRIVYYTLLLAATSIPSRKCDCSEAILGYAPLKLFYTPIWRIQI
jgi:hypothetical protein